MERFVPTLSERTTRYVLYVCGFLCFAIGGQSVFLTVYRGYGTGRSAIFAGGAFYLFGLLFWWLAYVER